MPVNDETMAPVLSYTPFQFNGVKWQRSIQDIPEVYLIVWGSQWNNGDPYNEISYLENLYKNISGTSYYNTLTQYCDRIKQFTTNCKKGRRLKNEVRFMGTYYDTADSVPSVITDDDIFNEAQKIIPLVGSSNLNSQYVILTPSGHSGDGFGITYCAWHGVLNGTPFTYIPYTSDVKNCGKDPAIVAVRSEEHTSELQSH